MFCRCADLFAATQGLAWVGFTASTGQFAYGENAVSNWNFSRPLTSLATSRVIEHSLTVGTLKLGAANVTATVHIDSR